MWDLSLKPSPEDKRDFRAESIYQKISLPSSFDMSNDLLLPRNQGSQGSCSAQTAAAIKEWQELKELDFKGYMSPQFVYNCRSNYGSDGMTPRDTMKILQSIGCVTEKLYPYGKIENRSQIDEDLIDSAEKYRIKNYAKCNTIESLKQSLIKDGPSYIAVPVFNYGERMWKPKPGESQLGGHAMTIVGYNKDGFVIRNSWGLNWNNNGHTLFPYEDWGLQWEVWTTIDAESWESEDEKPKRFRLCDCLKNVLDKIREFFDKLFH